MTIKSATRQWSSRRRRYAVGYISSGNVIYYHARQRLQFPMTLKEAGKALAKMESAGAAIFELTPISINR